METIFAKNVARNCEKKIILRTSDAWSMSHLSQRTSKPAYYIVDCQILGQCKTCIFWPAQSCTNFVILKVHDTKLYM